MAWLGLGYLGVATAASTTALFVVPMLHRSCPNIGSSPATLIKPQQMRGRGTSPASAPHHILPSSHARPSRGIGDGGWTSASMVGALLPSWCRRRELHLQCGCSLPGDNHGFSHGASIHIRAARWMRSVPRSALSRHTSVAPSSSSPQRVPLLDEIATNGPNGRGVAGWTATSRPSPPPCRVH
ncbi:hypothetical protein E2562_013748 [Oryza meyeriana var. granulata]|uniref:Uncharacterized protein n=1 Tax=Oryza meyeriana var. granulata TaxID=110450 RepID=A0A6G1BIZ0_9ORYZ|nr:hypothetical protein E2562_013748 [Oryza meyeriana var. granulata]